MKTVAAFAAFVAIGLVGLAGAACRKTQAVSATAGTERQDPYALMKDGFFAHPQEVQVAIARSAAEDVRRNLPDATLTFEEQAVVTNLGQALRAIVAYRGEAPVPGGGTQSFDAELRQYFHAKGAVVVEAACFSDGSPCKVPRELIDRTDAAVLRHLSDEGVSAILPPDAACETSPYRMRSHVNRRTVCPLGPDIRVSVMRLSREETLAQLR